jgi:hypothetical protein
MTALNGFTAETLEMETPAKNSTKDYAKFTFLRANREINKKNVEKIKESYREWGVIAGRPILIDKDFNIIDGQHRFCALRDLGWPITYEIITGNVIGKTMALNSSQDHWQLVDFVKSYAEQGMDNYRKLLKYEEKNKFGFTNSLHLCFGFKAKSHDIKKGRDFPFQENAIEIADYINNLEDVSFKTTKAFVYAVYVLFNKADLEQRTTIRNNILKIPKCTHEKDYRTAFENILNHKKKNNFVKL